eukprot:gene3961-16503_t
MQWTVANYPGWSNYPGSVAILVRGELQTSVDDYNRCRWRLPTIYRTVSNYPERLRNIRGRFQTIRGSSIYPWTVPTNRGRLQTIRGRTNYLGRFPLSVTVPNYPETVANISVTVRNYPWSVTKYPWMVTNYPWTVANYTWMVQKLSVDGCQLSQCMVANYPWTGYKLSVETVANYPWRLAKLPWTLPNYPWIDTSVGRPVEENEEITQTLREFWKQESSGIDKGSEPTNEDKQDEQFEITFNGKRYQNNKVWKQFVRHRVSDILRTSSRDEWFYCPGSQNPADLPSRGIFGRKLEQNLFWWEGPGFLKQPPTKWPKQEDIFESGSALEERVKCSPNITHAIATKENAKVGNVVDFE